MIHSENFTDLAQTQHDFDGRSPLYKKIQISNLGDWFRKKYMINIVEIITAIPRNHITNLKHYWDHKHNFPYFLFNSPSNAFFNTKLLHCHI